MKCTHLPTSLQRLIKTMSYVTIATVSPAGRPWNTPVVGRFDDNLHLYWVSWCKNRHSQNIANDSRIFVVMYDTSAPEGAGQGLYLQMRARMLTTPQEIEVAKRIYDTSFFVHPTKSHVQFLGQCPQRFFKAVPERIWSNTNGQKEGHFVDVRREILKT